MLEWFRDLNAIALMGFVALVALGLVMITGLVARRLQPQPSHSTAALDAYKIIVSFLAILLSFSLVQANALLRSSDMAVSTEAGAMNQLDRILVRVRMPSTDAIRPKLLEYMQSVLDKDWPAMRRGHDNSEAQPLLGSLNRAVLTLTPADLGDRPQLFAEIAKYLDLLNDSRQSRMDSVHVGLPAVLWDTTAILCTILLVLSAMIDVPARLVALGGHAVSIGVLLALTFAVDQPHRGSVSTSPAPIERVLDLVRTRVG